MAWKHENAGAAAGVERRGRPARARGLLLRADLLANPRHVGILPRRDARMRFHLTRPPAAAWPAGGNLWHPMNRRVVALWAIGAVVLGPPANAPAGESYLSAGWDSAYVSEGRSYLESDGFWSGEAGTELSGFSVGIWHGRGDGEAYREWDLAVGRTFELGPCRLGASYTRIGYPGMELPEDNELALDLSWSPASGWELRAATRYATEAAGAFVELSARREWTLRDGGLVFALYVLEGIDLGYASADYDGFNHAEVGIEAGFKLAPSISLTGRAAQCWAQGDVHRSGLDECGFAGLGISAVF